MLIRSAKLSLSMHSPRCFTTSQSGKVSLQEIWWRLSAQGSTLTTRLPSISSVLFLSSPRLPWRFVALHCVGNNFTRFANLKSNLSMMVFMLYAPHFLTDGTHTGTILNGIVSKNVKKKEKTWTQWRHRWWRPRAWTRTREQHKPGDLSLVKIQNENPATFSFMMFIPSTQSASNFWRVPEPPYNPKWHFVIL